MAKPQQAVTGKMPPGYFNFTKSPAYVGNQKKTAGLVGRGVAKPPVKKKKQSDGQRFVMRSHWLRLYELE